MSDSLRYCVYCGADCIDYDTIEVSHATDCPQKTGLYPVRSEDLPSWGFICMDCQHPFELGDFYVNRTTETEGIYESVCVGCGALSAVVGYGS